MFTLQFLTQGKELVRNRTADFKVNFQDIEDVLKYLKADTGMLIVTKNYYGAVDD